MTGAAETAGKRRSGSCKVNKSLQVPSLRSPHAILFIADSFVRSLNPFRFLPLKGFFIFCAAKLSAFSPGLEQFSTRNLLFWSFHPWKNII